LCISQRLPLTLCLLLLLRWQKVRVLFVSSFPARNQGALPSRAMIGDIFFLTDSSERISEEGFQKMKNFTKSVISKSIIGLDKVHIGVMQYSTNTRLEFDLTTHYSLEGMLNTIDGMMQNKTRTRTGRAITEVSQYFDAARGGRPWVKQWLVVITDGKSEDSVREPARALRAKGVVIYAIGVNKTNVQELSEISGSLQRAFIENTFDGWKELETKLALEFCEKGKRGCFKPSVIKIKISKKNWVASVYFTMKTNSCVLKADIIFLVDGSESMTEEQFKSTKSFLASVVNQNTVGENLTRFGVILYSRTAKSEFTLKEIYSKGKVLEALQQLVQPKGGTYTGAALAYSLPYFNAEHGGRRAIRVPQILMVITDGDSRDSDRLKAESDALCVQREILCSLIDFTLKTNQRIGIRFLVGLLCINDVKCLILAFSLAACNQTDLVFLLDYSSSINQSHIGVDNFEEIRQFLRSFILGLDIGPDKIRIGLAQYSDETYQEFLLKDHMDKDSLLAEVDQFPYRTGGRETGKAIDFLQSVYFTKEAGSRASQRVPQFAVVITDGDSTDDVVEPAKRLRDQGVIIFGIGVGEVNQQELESIVNLPAHHFLYTIDSYQALQRLTDSLLQTVCISESLKPNLESRDSVCLLNPNWKLVPQKRGLKTEGSASHSTFKYSRNNK
uniref:Collagen type VI alpha 6 chain n=1 Tax=Oreochromis niloticus TaxID=8128 RepID=A0A669DHU1_ORENI